MHVFEGLADTPSTHCDFWATPVPLQVFITVCKTNVRQKSSNPFSLYTRAALHLAPHESRFLQPQPSFAGQTTTLHLPPLLLMCSAADLVPSSCVHAVTRLLTLLGVAQELELMVKDRAISGRPIVGCASLPLSELPLSGQLSRWIPLKAPTVAQSGGREQAKEADGKYGEVLLDVSYRPFVDDEQVWNWGRLHLAGIGFCACIGDEDSNTVQRGLPFIDTDAIDM